MKKKKKKKKKKRQRDIHMGFRASLDLGIEDVDHQHDIFYKWWPLLGKFP